MAMFVIVILAVLFTPSPSNLVASQGKNCAKNGVVIPALGRRAFVINSTTCEVYYCYSTGRSQLMFFLSQNCTSGCVNTSSTETCACLRNCPAPATESGKGSGSGSEQPSEARSNPCGRKPCKNGGTCSVLYGGRFKCACTADYGGPQCQIPVDWCQRKGCQNGATCVPDSSLKAKARCDCAAGYTGDRCEKHVCQPNPCRNGGTCSVDTTDSSGYTCSCANGQTGRTCLLCTDSGSTCDAMKTAGKCESDRETMLTQCARTCGFCKIPECYTGFTFNGISCYKAQDSRQKYSVANRTCHGEDSEVGEPVSVSIPRSRKENIYLRKLLRGGMWVGARYEPKREAWMAGTGTVAFAGGQFENWSGKGKPQGNLKSRTCIKMTKKGKWSTTSCKDTKVFVCRYDL